jgi:WD40 repeat protein
MRRRISIAIVGSAAVASLTCCGGLSWWWMRDPLGAYRTLRQRDVVNAIAFDETGELIATGGGDGLRIWRVSSGEQVGFYAWRVAALRWVKDKLVIAAPDEGIVVLHTSTWEVEQTLGQASAAMALDVSPDGRWIAASFSPFFPSGERNLTPDSFAVSIWDTHTNQHDTLVGHVGPVTAIAFDPKNSNTLVTGSRDRTVRVWDRGSKSATKVVGKLLDLSKQGSFAGSHISLDISPDGHRLLRGRNLCPLAAPDCSRQLGDPTMRGTLAGKFSRNGRWIATGHEDGQLRLWSAIDRELVASFPASKNEAEIYAVAFSPDGALIAAGGKGEIGRFNAINRNVPTFDRAVRIWRLADLVHGGLGR